MCAVHDRPDGFTRSTGERAENDIHLVRLNQVARQFLKLRVVRLSVVRNQADWPAHDAALRVDFIDRQLSGVNFGDRRQREVA
jgi:hypothetical protein